MNWIRLHYDRFALALAALFLLICATLIYFRASKFDDTFSAVKTSPGASNAIPAAKAPEVEQELAKLHQSPLWLANGKSGLFVPEKHFVNSAGELSTVATTQIHPPLTNDWIEKYSLPIADADLLQQDPDADGFTNYDEYTGGIEDVTGAHATDPTDKTSHPPYVTKLRLKAFVQKPFRLVFSSWVGDSYAINTKDLNQPTLFLKLGDMIKGTKFKITKFEEKYENDKYGTKVDVSELTLENQETKELLHLPKEKVINSPESFAQMIYLWGEPMEFRLKKDQEFSLKPQDEIKYKLLDVQPEKATIINVAKPAEQIEIALQKQ